MGLSEESARAQNAQKPSPQRKKILLIEKDLRSSWSFYLTGVMMGSCTLLHKGTSNLASEPGFMDSELERRPERRLSLDSLRSDLRQSAQPIPVFDPEATPQLFPARDQLRAASLSLFGTPETHCTNPPIQMTFDEAEAILCSPLLGPALELGYHPSPKLSTPKAKRPSMTPLDLEYRSPYLIHLESPCSLLPSSVESSASFDRQADVSGLQPSLPESPRPTPVSSDIQDSEIKKSTKQARPRARTQLTPYQRSFLMGIFDENPTPESSVIRKAAAKVGKDFRLVQYWFQNRRAALRKSEREIEK
ncbi:hypothetical protein BDR26DRAFT_914607 [Obelidium mucronatum]|nr:hypothetical protein BDR26DRAFT_914607 [Obelidium mucronatum]